MIDLHFKFSASSIEEMRYVLTRVDDGYPAYDMVPTAQLFFVVNGLDLGAFGGTAKNGSRYEVPIIDFVAGSLAVLDEISVGQTMPYLIPDISHGYFITRKSVDTVKLSREINPGNTECGYDELKTALLNFGQKVYEQVRLHCPEILARDGGTPSIEDLLLRQCQTL